MVHHRQSEVMESLSTMKVNAADNYFEMEELMDNGANVRDVAEQLGVSRSTISRWDCNGIVSNSRAGESRLSLLRVS